MKFSISFPDYVRMKYCIVPTRRIGVRTDDHPVKIKYVEISLIVVRKFRKETPAKARTFTCYVISIVKHVREGSHCQSY
ncbi:hypothetical protein MASR1M36_19830 [Candidatus Cloacimonadaceae bacterium]